MLEIKTIADIMEILVEDCRKCPLERTCDEFDCSHIWEHFFETKVKEGGVEKLELEKILEEIEIAKNDYLSKCFKWYKNGLEEAEIIIRKHMDGIDSSTDDLISRQALLEDFRNTITEQSSTLDWLNMIARQKAIRINDGKDINVPTKDGWIPVDERLPTEEEYIGGYDRDIPWLKRLEIAYMTDTLVYKHGYYDGFKWFDERHRKIENVIAWKIHDPYRTEKE